jgi:O-antigen/teichoic acid export membrane protein/serine acetyltransferase
VSRGKLIAKNAGFLAIGQALTWTSTLLFLLVVPRALGPSEWGAWSVALAMTAVAGSLAGLGLQTLLTKEIARDTKRTSEFVGAALIAQFLLAIPFVVIVATASLSAGYTLHTRVIIALTTAYTLVYFLGIPLSAALQALEQMHYLTIANIVARVVVSLAAVFLVTFVHNHGGVNAICVVGLVAALVSTGLEVHWLNRTTSVRLNWNWTLIGELCVASLPYWGTGVFVTIYTWVDSVMLSFMATTTVVGWYGAATRLFNTLLFLPTILTTALLPALSHTFKHEPEEMAYLARRSFVLQTSLSLPIAAGTILLGPAMIRLLFGTSFGPAGPALMVLALALIPMYMNMLVNQFLVAADRQVVWTRVMGVMCLVNPAINVVTIRYFQRVIHNGAVGASAALLTTETLMAVTGVVLMPRGILGRSTLPPIVRALICTLVMSGVVWALRGDFILIPMATGTAVFLALAVTLRVFPHEDMVVLGSLGGRVARKLGLRYRLRTSLADQMAGVDPTLVDLLIEDWRAWHRYELSSERDLQEPLGLRAALTLLWTYPGLRATCIFRLSAEAQRLHVPIVPGLLYRRNVRCYGLDIAPSVPIGPGLYIPHPVGTIVNARSIGSDCRLEGAVTIGRHGSAKLPTLGSHVVVGSGACVLGQARIGDSTMIAPNAVVTTDVPNDKWPVAMPAFVVAPREKVAPAAREHALTSLPNGNGHHHTNGHSTDRHDGQVRPQHDVAAFGVVVKAGLDPMDGVSVAELLPADDHDC